MVASMQFRMVRNRAVQRVFEDQTNSGGDTQTMEEQK
jgi:hypothetical protein